MSCCGQPSPPPAGKRHAKQGSTTRNHDRTGVRHLGALLLPAHAATNQLTGRAFSTTMAVPVGSAHPPDTPSFGDCAPIVMTASTTVYRGHIEGTTHL
jgi:hypothetical protein